ncbi:MAG TPA: DEAD/DEAH box helicase [Xanthobacteraceae bacterium]|jgi:superfamily II DNA or RNA helicase
MTKHDRLMLWRSYEGLLPYQKTAMRLLALIGDQVPRGTFVQALAAARTRAPDGKGWSNRSAEALLQELRAQGLLERDLSCVASLRHQIAVDAAEGEQAAILASALARALPRSDYEKPNVSLCLYHHYPLARDRDLLRSIHLAVYTNDAAEFARLRQIYDRHEVESGEAILPLHFAELPADIAWLERRAPAIRESVITGFVTALVETGTIKADAAAAVDYFTGSGGTPSPALNDALLWRDVLAGKFESARARIAALPSEDSIARTTRSAIVHFLTGHNSEAIAGFGESLKQLRKLTSRRKCVLYGLAGVFHILALLREHDPKLHSEVRNLLDTARSGGQLLWMEQVLRALLEVACGHEEKAEQAIAQFRHARTDNPIGAALISLARLHVDGDAAAANIAADEAAFERVAAYLPVIGRIHAEILARLSPQQEHWRTVLSKMGPEGVIAFTDIVGLKPKWERAFERLTGFLAPKATASAAAPGAELRKRLIFVLDPRTCEIQALEQANKGSGWTSGRPVALKRLSEQDSKLDYLTPADRRVLPTIRKQAGWYGPVEYAFDEYKSVLALIGHPHVFDARERGRRVELIAHPAELVVSETPQGYVFRISHSSAEPTVFIEEETVTRWRVIEVSKKLVELQGTLGNHGLVVPAHMRDRVISLLGADNPILPIRSELAGIEVPAVEGIAAPVLRLRRADDVLSVSLLVRPLGPEGPSYLPGRGGRSVLAIVNGARQRGNRDLAAEIAAAEQLIAACQTLQPWSAAPYEWHIESLEASLAFLEELQSASLPVSFEWPDGEPLKVSAAISTKRLSLRVASQRDWFEISGRIAVDEDLVIDMQDVLSRLERAHGRFVPLDGGRFLTLTADLKRQLQQLDAVSNATGHGRRLRGPGAMAVEELIADAGEVTADSRWHELVSNIRAAGAHRPVVPSNLQAELRDYQREGFVWLSRLAKLEMGACLADDMGLGKTVQAIALLLEQADRGASLVIAPTSVCHNWENELARFAPTLAVHRLGAAADRRTCVEALGPGGVLIASYGLLHQDETLLASRPWNVIVFDEAQNLKNVDTKRAQASQKLEGRVRLALSGTPIENYLDELWSLFNTINPGLLGSRERFARRFAGPIERGDASARNALRTLIRPFILRRAKSAVLTELPPRTELKIEVTQGEEERAFYEALRRRALATLAALDGPAGQRKIHILAEITRLRRACCHPGLIDPRSTIESAKLRAFLELVDELLRNRHKALVFSQFIGHLEKIREALDARGVRYHYLDGAVPAQQRATRVAAFQASEGNLFLISLKAGGTGLNLTAADFVIHLDPWWNPAVEDQASDRAHRIGQNRPVTIYRLVVADSIEERILDLHRHKRDLAADLLAGAETSARLSEDELLELIRQ